MMVNDELIKSNLTAVYQQHYLIALILHMLTVLHFAKQGPIL